MKIIVGLREAKTGKWGLAFSVIHYRLGFLEEK